MKSKRMIYILGISCYYNKKVRRHGQVVRQRSAKPSSPVQIRLSPLKDGFWEPSFFYVEEGKEVSQGLKKMLNTLAESLLSAKEEQ